MTAARSILTWGAFLAAVSVSVLLALSAPVVLIAIFAGLIGLVMAVTRPKAFLAALVVLVLFGLTLETVSRASALGLIDEVAVIAALATAIGHRVARGQGLHRMPGIWFLLLWLIAAAVSSALHGVGVELAVTTAFLFLKGPLVVFAFLQFDWTPSDIRRGVKLGGILTAVVLAFGAVNAIIPGQWAALLSSQGVVDVRYGITSLVGPFTHPFAFGQFMALAFIAVLLYRATVRRSLASLVLLIATGLGAVLSGRRKALAGMAAGAIISRLFLPGGRGIWILALILTAPIIIFVSFEQLSVLVSDIMFQYLVQADTAARSIMYRDSLGIVARDFPWGAGLGRYGSYGALAEYSPEYISRGYYLIYGMGPENALYMTDTFWPAVWGETGLVGFIGYAGMLVMLSIHAAKARKSENALTRWVGLVAIGWSVEFAVESVAAPVYSSPPLFMLLSVVLGVGISLARAESATSSVSSARVQRSLSRR